MTHFYGNKEFVEHTKINDILGKNVVVISKLPHERITGELSTYGMHDKTIFLKNYTVTRRNPDTQKWETIRSGDLIIIKKDGWIALEVKKL